MRHKTCRAGKNRQGMKFKYRFTVGKRRFGNEVVALAMKAVLAIMRDIAVIAMWVCAVLVIGQPVMQTLFGCNAKGKHQQQKAG